MTDIRQVAYEALYDLPATYPYSKLTSADGETMVVTVAHLKQGLDAGAVSPDYVLRALLSKGMLRPTAGQPSTGSAQ